MALPAIFAQQSILRIQVRLADSGPDRAMDCVNVFHFAVNAATFDITEGGLDDFTDAIDAFYAECGDGIAGRISRSTSEMKLYDMSQPQPNAPLATGPLTLPAAAPTNYSDLPAEAALCVSYAAEPVSGIRPQSLRGRIYVGPLRVPIGADLTRPASTDVAKMVAAGQALLDLSDAATYWRWCVFSPTQAGGWLVPGQSGPPNLQGAAARVTNGWVDNAWDTQRRRGLDPTSRTAFT